MSTYITIGASMHASTAMLIRGYMAEIHRHRTDQASPVAVTNTPSASFNSLPKEIIYHIVTKVLLLHMPNGIVEQRSAAAVLEAPLLPIFQVSGTLRVIAQEILLQDFTFMVRSIEDARRLKKWLTGYGQMRYFNHTRSEVFSQRTAAKCLRSLAMWPPFFVMPYEQTEFFKLLQLLPNLSHLALRFQLKPKDTPRGWIKQACPQPDISVFPIEYVFGLKQLQVLDLDLNHPTSLSTKKLRELFQPAKVVKRQLRKHNEKLPKRRSNLPVLRVNVYSLRCSKLWYKEKRSCWKKAMLGREGVPTFEVFDGSRRFSKEIMPCAGFLGQRP